MMKLKVFTIIGLGCGLYDLLLKFYILASIQGVEPELLEFQKSDFTI